MSVITVRDEYFNRGTVPGILRFTLAAASPGEFAKRSLQTAKRINISARLGPLTGIVDA